MCRARFLQFMTIFGMGLLIVGFLACGGGGGGETDKRPVLTITEQPTNETVRVGQTATFTVVASGAEPVTYQWRRNGSAIPGGTSASYTTPATAMTDSGAKFSVVVADSVSSLVSKDAILTINSATSDWPDASNTGIPAGTTLTVYTGPNHTVSDGQVFDGLEFPNRIYVDHAGVVFRNCRLTGDDYYAIYATVPGRTTPQGGVNLTVENCDITSGVLILDGFTGRRNHLHAAAGKTRDDGWSFSASNILLEDNLIDGLVGGPGAHLDGIQAMGGDNIVIRHNWIEAVSPPITEGGGVNAAIFISPAAAFGNRANTNVVVENNMLIEEAGYYPLRIEAQGTVVVRHNRWRRGHLGAPCHLVNTIVTTWEDNAYEDGTVITAP